MGFIIIYYITGCTYIKAPQELVRIPKKTVKEEKSEKVVIGEKLWRCRRVLPVILRILA